MSDHVDEELSSLSDEDLNDLIAEHEARQGPYTAPEVREYLEELRRERKRRIANEVPHE